MADELQVEGKLAHRERDGQRGFSDSGTVWVCNSLLRHGRCSGLGTGVGLVTSGKTATKRRCERNLQKTLLEMTTHKTPRPQPRSLYTTHNHSEGTHALHQGTCRRAEG